MLKKTIVVWVMTGKLLQSSTHFTHGIAGREIKTKVESNIEAPHTARFYNTIWNYKLCQLTTSNIKRMKEATIDGNNYFNNNNNSSSSDNNNNSNFSSTNSSDDSNSENSFAPVVSNLQPHAIHKFVKDDAYHIILCVPKNSQHYRNMLECKKVSVMIGHTDPQLFHWFKQLGTLPPRAILSGQVEALSEKELAEVWDATLIRHPVLHSMAEDMWNKNDSKTEEEKKFIEKRHQEEDEKRMHRLSNSDWRTKFKERERNPTEEEDTEMPIYVLKPETFAVYKLNPQIRLWMNVSGQTLRVWDPVIPHQDPIGKAAMRFVKMLNMSRNKLVPTLNLNFELKLVNAFMYDVDQHGFWGVGTEERKYDNHVTNDINAGGVGGITESWKEYRFEFGKDQNIRTEEDVEWWIRGLSLLGSPEMTASDNQTSEAQSSPESYGFRHT